MNKKEIVDILTPRLPKFFTIQSMDDYSVRLECLCQINDTSMLHYVQIPLETIRDVAHNGQIDEFLYHRFLLVFQGAAQNFLKQYIETQ